MSDIRIGTSGWHYADWIGLFYPTNAKAKDFLSFYIGRFSSVEINNSFYRLPTDKAVAAWRDAVPDDFLISWKASRLITHFKRLNNVEENIAFVFERMAGLGAKQGAVLFQLPPNFKADAERLAHFLGQLPPRLCYAIEFRHPSWFEPAILDVLRDHDVSLCLSDHAHAPAPWIATAGHVYLRPHGPEGRYAGSYGDEVLRAWAATIRGWRREGRRVFCYFDNDQKSAAPFDAKRLQNFVAEAER